jgi:M6 family metalloprotease-like protein
MVPLLLALLLQDPELESALSKERARIAAKTPLSETERKGYTSPAGAASKAVAGYRLAVVPLDFPGAESSRETKEDVAAVAAFYKEMAAGAFALESSAVPRYRTESARAEVEAWPTGGESEKRLALAAIGALRNKLGEEAFAKIDGVAFVAAGAIGKRGTALWPHQDSVEMADRKIGYLVLPEDLGARWRAIATHEFGHLLGLEDKYEPSLGVGKWCLLGTGYLGEAGDKEKKPLPLCAVCRARLGWLAEGTVDPRKESSIVLSPGGSVRVPLAKDGREALVLELRGTETVLAWHTGGGKAIELVGALPSAESDRLTPWSRPALAGRTAGWLSVCVTDLRLEAGRAWFKVGPEAALTPVEELVRSRVGKTLK